MFKFDSVFSHTCLLSLSLIHSSISFSPAMTTYFLGLADNDIHNPAKQRVANGYRKLMIVSLIGLVNEYPAMHYFGNPSYSQSMITYIILTEYSGNSSVKLHCGTLINMPYSILSICILV